MIYTNKSYLYKLQIGLEIRKAHQRRTYEQTFGILVLGLMAVKAQQVKSMHAQRPANKKL